MTVYLALEIYKDENGEPIGNSTIGVFSDEEKAEIAIAQQEKENKEDGVDHDYSIDTATMNVFTTGRAVEVFDTNEYVCLTDSEKIKLNNN